MSYILADILGNSQYIDYSENPILNDILNNAGRDGNISNNENFHYRRNFYYRRNSNIHDIRDSISGQILNTYTGDDFVKSSDYNDIIRASFGNDVVLGNQGDDIVKGGFGNDILMGNKGDDIVKGGFGNDFLLYSISENKGNNDYYNGGYGNDTLLIGLSVNEYLQNYSKLQELSSFVTNNQSRNRRFFRRRRYFSSYTINFDNQQSLTIKNIENVDFVLTERNFRTIDGSYNNIDYPDRGKIKEQLTRIADIAYEDGISVPRGGDPTTLPSPREISNIVASQSESIINSAGVTDWFWQWGQFIDHDLSLTEPIHPTEPFNIKVPTGDPFFDPFNTGSQEIELNRSIYDDTTGIDISNPRQQINEITAYLDASMVYGSEEERAEALRANDGSGKLAYTIGDNGEILLPYNLDNNGDGEGDFANANIGTNSPDFFLAGDIRANEQLGLIAIHTLFVREHNRLADYFSSLLDSGDTTITKLYDISGLDEGDFIYEASRRVVGAEIQAITYNEFLPLLLGNDGLNTYNGYDSTVDVSINNEFSTAALRFGHTMLSPQLFLDGNGYETISLQNSFFRPDLAESDGIDSLLLGLASQEAQEIDPFVIDDVRNFLFGPPGAGGFDLASLNIQRGRDHGLASYNDTRIALGLEAADDFDDITGNVDIQNSLASVYDSVDDIDLWIGGLAEDKLMGSMVGETFHEIISDQFERLRDGDSFYYEQDFWLEQLNLADLGFGAENIAIADISLSEIIELNSGVDLQDNAFLHVEPIIL